MLVALLQFPRRRMIHRYLLSVVVGYVRVISYRSVLVCLETVALSLLQVVSSSKWRFLLA